MTDKMSSDSPFRRSSFRTMALLLSIMVLVDIMYLVSAGSKGGRDIIISKGKVIIKSGKKKGNIMIVSDPHDQGKYKYKKQYMNYGGYWR